jgi:hypothetical protein
MTFWAFVGEHPVWSMFALIIITSTLETVASAIARRQ